MGKFISNFETTSEYTAAQESLETPHISLTKDNMKIYYKPYYDPYNGHEYVEIGGLKWATMNIGATSETGGGLYFQWGDIQGYTPGQVGNSNGRKSFKWADYKYGNGTDNPGAAGMTKYNKTDNLVTLEISDDAARAIWGGSWRIPTEADFQTLINATTSSWVTNYNGSNVNGRLLISKTDSNVKLFFPAAGSCYNSNSGQNWNGRGQYLSSTLSTVNATINRILIAYSSSFTMVDGDGRCWGYTIRGVISEN